MVWLFLVGPLLAAPTITTPPADVAVVAGQPATFSVVATGAGTLTYQWLRNGFAISGATAATYTIPAASRTDADLYEVMVADGLAAVTSSSSRLVVTPSTSPGFLKVDPTWNVALESTNVAMNTVLPLANGQFLVGGDFIKINGHRTGDVARFNADGTIDPTFAAPVLDGYVKALAVQADGKIVVGGRFRLGWRAELIRLNGDGSLDESFAPSMSSATMVWALAIDEQGRIYLGGDFSQVGSETRGNLARLKADGTLDMAYNPAPNNGVRALALQADGKLLAGGYFTAVAGVSRSCIARLNVDGSLDPTFEASAGASNGVATLAISPTGKIYVGGYFYSFNGTSSDPYLRLNADGSRDSTFTTRFSGNSVETMVATLDGGAVVGGSFYSIGWGNRTNLARLAADGMVAAAPPALSIGNTVLGVGLDAGGQVIAAGYFSAVGATPRQGLARIKVDGTLDSAVDPIVRQQGTVNGIAPVPGGKLAIAGEFSTVNGTARANVAQLNADGSLDTSFDPGTGANSYTTSIVRQADGKLVLSGYFYQFNGQNRRAVVRLLPSGGLDPDFATPVSQIYLDYKATPGRAGKIFLSFGQADLSFGSAGTRSYIAQLNADGSLDASFAPVPNGSVYSILPQGGGRVVLGGNFRAIGTTSAGRIVRLEADGSVEAGFSTAVGTGFDNPVLALAPAGLGQLWTAGYSQNVNGITRGSVVRLSDGGQVAPWVGSEPFQSWSSWLQVAALLPQSDGKVIVAGNVYLYSGAPPFQSVARVNADGSLDRTFGVADFSPTATAAVQADDGTLYLGSSSGLVRLTTATAVAITSQPVNVAATVGGNVTFSVTATGDPAPSYQWTFNGAAIAGATKSTLTLTDVQLAQTGQYAVIVSNGLGSVTSQAVTLTGTNPAPTITTQPTDVAVKAGQPVSFTVGAHGTGALGYQWRRNGFPIPGATTVSYTLATASRTDADFYDVLVNDGLSATASTSVRLDVAPASYPGITRIDPDWNVELESPNAAVNVVVALADGKFLVGGDFVRIGGHRTGDVARFNADGSVDTTFVAPVLNGYVKALAVQADGKIVVGGAFSLETKKSLLRLNADGSLDAGFSPDLSDYSPSVVTLAIGAEGEIYFGGSFSYVANSHRTNLARLKADGSLDASYAPQPGSALTALRLQPDGKLLVGGSFNSIAGAARTRLARLNRDGTNDESFDPGTGPDNAISSLAVSPTGKIYIGGGLSHFNGFSTPAFARLNVDGSVDSSFVVDGLNAIQVNSVAAALDGGVLFGGQFWFSGQAGSTGLLRLAADGTIASSPSPGVDSAVLCATLASDGQVLMVGLFNSVAASARQHLARIAADGTLDSRVNPVVRQAGSVRSLALVPGGKVAVAGDFTTVNGVARNNVAQINADGSLDTSFDPGSGANLNTTSIVRQADGKLLLGGYFTSFNGETRRGLLRLLPDGAVDESFSSLSFTADMRLVAARAGQVMLSFSGSYMPFGSVTRNWLTRLRADGTLDASFVATPNGWPTAMAMQPDGRLLIGGDFTSVNSTSTGGITRLNGDGSPDPAFATGNSSGLLTRALMTIPGGGIWAGGSFYYLFNNSYRSLIVRLRDNGAADESFGPAPFTSWDENGVTSFIPQNDGKIIVAGGIYALTNNPAGRYVARLNADGTGDPSFAVVGVPAAVSALAQDDAGHVYVGTSMGLMRSTSGSLPPYITNQPRSFSSLRGARVTFSVSAVGAGALTYEWRKNGAAIPNATTTSLTLDQVQTGDYASYTVAVTDVNGTTVSMPAILSEAAAIVTPGQTRTLAPGASATFSVDTTGGVQTYQWFKNGVAIDGATTSSFAISNASASDKGVYAVTVSNGVTSASQVVAAVTVKAFTNTFASVGDLPGGVAGSQVRAVSEDGDIAVGTGSVLLASANKGNGDRAFRWTRAGGVSELPNAVTVTGGTTFVAAEDITPDGSIIAGRVRLNATASDCSPALFTDQGTKFSYLGRLYGGTTANAATALSADGAVVYGFSGTSAVRLYLNGAVSSLGAPSVSGDSGAPAARGVSADGSVLVGTESPDASVGKGAKAYVYSTASGLTWIGSLPGGSWSAALGVTSDGVTVFGLGNSAEHPEGEFFLWRKASGFTPLGAPGESGLATTGSVAADASVQVAGDVVHNSHGFAKLPAVLAQAGLDVAGWSELQLFGMSQNACVLYGYGRNPAGDYEGWVATFESGFLAQVVGAPILTAQTPWQKVFAGNDAIFTVSVNGTASYQWQRSMDGGANWGDLGDGGAFSGVTTAALKVAGVDAAMSGWQFRAVITSSGGSTISAAAALSTLGTSGNPVGTAWSVYDSGTRLPVTVAKAITRDVTSIVSRSHSMWIKSDGSLWGVGSNSSGQLGDGTTVDRSMAVQVVASGVVKVAVGSGHTMFIKSDGTLWGMGNNGYGQLGDGTTLPRSTPVQVPGATHVTAVAAGGGHTLFLRSDGTLWTMGLNDAGQLCAGPSDNQSIYLAHPTPVQVAAEVSSIAAPPGSNSYFVKTDGTLWSVGLNDGGQLGDGSTVWGRATVAQIAAGVRDVVAGTQSVLFIKTDGTLWTFGGGVGVQLGDTVNPNRNLPVQIAADVTQAAAGARFSLFQKTDGTLWGLGDNSVGQLGAGAVMINTATQVASGVAAFTASYGDTFYVSADGILHGVGSDSTGELGDGQIPSVLPIATGVTRATAGYGGILAVATKSDGTLWRRFDFNGPLHQVAGVDHVVDVVVGGFASKVLYLKSDGTLWQLSTQDDTSTQVASGVIAAGAGMDFIVYLKSDGSLWGQGSSGWPIALGDGTHPARIADRVVSLSAAGWHILFVTDDHSLWGMGNPWGGFGDQYDYGAGQSYPIRLESDVAFASATSGENIYVKTDGVLWARGNGWNSYAGPAVQIDRDVTAAVANGTVYLKADGVLRVTSGVQGAVEELAAGVSDIRCSESVTVYLQTAGTGTAPTITQAAFSRNAEPGSSFTLGIAVAGSGPMSYQWFKDGVAIPWARATQLTIPYAQASDAGSYTVTVTNSAGSVTSAAAAVVVGTAPVFTTQPSATTVNAGGAAIFNAVATGDPAPTYQWRRNQVNLTGETNATLTLSGVQLADSGAVFDVIATNAAGSSTSSSAVLTVNGPSFTSYLAQSFTPLELADATISGPAADPDADGLSNLAEYALGQNPKANDQSGLPVIGSDSGKLTLTYTKRNDVPDLIYTVEASSDLASWTSGAGVTEQLSSTAIDATHDRVVVRDLTALSSVSRRFLRLRVTLSSPTASIVSPPFGAVNVSFAQGKRLTGMPLVNAATARDQIASHTTTTLTLGHVTDVGALLTSTKSYFVEITGGAATAYIGDRFEVDVTATKTAANNTLTIVSASPRSTLATLPAAGTLANCTVVVRPHVTLGQLFGTKGNTPMFGSTVSANADQIQVLNPQTQSFEIYYLLRNLAGTIEQWTKVAGGSTNQDTAPLAAGTGMVVVRAAATPVAVAWLGEVRQNAFAQPLVAGNNLIAQPFPVDLSPVERSMSHGNGWTGSTISSSADQIQVYVAGSFQIYYLLRNPAGTVEQWTKVSGGSTNYNQTKLVGGDAAVVIRRISADANYLVPLPAALTP